MMKQSKVDAMNEAVADFIIKKVESLNPDLATDRELSSLAELVRVVNVAPKTVPLTGVAVGEPIKPYKKKRHR